MSHNIENHTESSAAKGKTLLAVGILVASVTGYYYFTDVHSVLRVLMLVLGVMVAGWVFYGTEKGQSWIGFLGQARKEVRQVVWPTRQETIQMTLIVFVVVILMGIFLWLVDMFFLWMVQLLTGQGG